MGKRIPSYGFIIVLKIKRGVINERTSYWFYIIGFYRGICSDRNFIERQKIMETEVVVMDPDKMSVLVNKLFDFFQQEKLSVFEGYAVLKYSKMHMEEQLGIKQTFSNFDGTLGESNESH